MEYLSFKDISKESINAIHKIQDDVVQKIYSQFIFYQISFTQNDEIHLFNFLKNFKFITYLISDKIINSIRQKTINNDNNFLTSNQAQLKLIICIEKKCLIIEPIDHSSIIKIINKLKNEQISLINVSQNIKNDMNTNEEAFEEVSNFFSRYKNINNEFFLITKYPIMAYLIRRYFYPTDYFEDPSFFVYESSNYSNEKILKKNFNDILTKEKLNNEKLESFANNIQKIHIDEEKPRNRTYYENEFFLLRRIYFNLDATFYLAIHYESLYIFMIKKFNFFHSKNIYNEREIEFCENLQIRYLTHFYGFLKKK